MLPVPLVWQSASPNRPHTLDGSANQRLFFPLAVEDKIQVDGADDLVPDGRLA